MFSFFRKKVGKHENPTENAEHIRKRPNERAENRAPVAPRALRQNDNITSTRKDVVNLLIPETNYNQKSGVSALFHNIMPGKRRRKQRYNKITRAESCREMSPLKETAQPTLQRSVSDLESTYKQQSTARDVIAPTLDENTLDAAENDESAAADFVKALVLQKYANKTPIDTKKQHVSLVYVSNEPNIDEKRHAELLLREIARSIDCTVEKINEEKELMGTTDSKNAKQPTIGRKEPLYETIDDRNDDQDIKSLKDDLKGELEKLLKEQNDVKNDEKVPNEDVNESEKTTPVLKKKSNLKPPKTDSEGCSDDDRSEGSKKKVTFRKHILFDDGDQQTDQETDSSFDSLTSESESDSDETEEEVEEEEHAEESVPIITTDDDNSTLIQNINQNEQITIKIECCDNEANKQDNTEQDSGFVEISDVDDKSNKNDTQTVDSDSEVTASDTDSEEVIVSESLEVQGIVEEVDDDDEYEEIEVDEEEEENSSELVIAEIIEPDDHRHGDFNQKTLVTHDAKFQQQVAALTELTDARCNEADQTKDLITQYRKEIEDRDQEIERLKCSLAAAYKESELVRQRSRSLEEELAAARTCSAGLARQLAANDENDVRRLKSQLEDALNSRAELESRVQALERDRDRLEQEKRVQEQKAQEALATAEATTTKWRLAHESARSQAAARAERMLADCEWKMRELEKRAREAEKKNGELIESVEELKSAKTQPSASHMAELQQLRGLATEQQRSVQALTLQLQKVETREEALKLEVHRLKELLDKQIRIGQEKDERHMQTVTRLKSEHASTLEQTRGELTAAAAAARANAERLHADRTRTALQQLRLEADKDMKNAERKLREVTARFENLKEELATKESQWERSIAEANSKADWELLQLRHLLDRADITYANNMEKANEKFEREKEFIVEEWTSKVRVLENKMATEQSEARKLLELTRSQLIAEKNDLVNKLKEQHRKEIDDQWEKLQQDKESCLARMKEECKLEGEEERVQREKELMEEIAELKLLVQSKVTDYDSLESKAAACGRTLAVTEQELREALAREKELREKRSDDAAKIKQVERASKDQVDHLTRKCACLRKLFDDMRAKLTERERAAAEQARDKDSEIMLLKAEVARLTQLLVQGSPKLGARTCADGCENAAETEDNAYKAETEGQNNTPRRKGT